ncbi:hypothetical protein FHT85_005974 [Rhizobium sp. BK312]|nr:hypothetical protein [Rhizobium sp. BK312]
MQHIIMLPHIIIIGIPDDIMDIMRLQHSMNMSLSMPSIGIISQTMPFGVILQVILPIIICIMGIIIGFIMAFIIGIAPIIGMLLIMGFIIGIMFIAGFIIVVSGNRPRSGLQ